MAQREVEGTVARVGSTGGTSGGAGLSADQRANPLTVIRLSAKDPDKAWMFRLFNGSTNIVNHLD